jgi:hypothetical protein
MTEKQYHYEAKFKVENLKLQTKLREILKDKLLPNEFKKIEFKGSGLSTGDYPTMGFTLHYAKNKVSRRYLLSKDDGLWYEVPNAINYYSHIGFKVNDDTIDSLVYDIQLAYAIPYKEGMKLK